MLRKLIASVLIVILTSQCFYKLVCITYYQLNKDYIAEFLCVNRDNPITVCYGQCFLKKALGFESETNTSSITSNLKFELPVFKMDAIICVDSPVEHIYISFTEYHAPNQGLYSSSIFHPPLFAC